MLKNISLQSIFDHKTKLYFVAVVLGFASGFLSIPAINTTASTISELFINLLKLVSLPIIFLSIVSTITGMESIDEIKHLGRRVIRYTLLTTVIAAVVALTIFLIIDPVRGGLPATLGDVPSDVASGSYLSYLIQAIPSNIVQPFYENNVIGVLFLAMALSVASLTLPSGQRKVLHTLFSSLYAVVMKITLTVIKWIPLAIWAFVTLFILDLRNGLEVESLGYYLACVLLANVVQAVIVLPLLLRVKGVSPKLMLKGMMPALSVAFFSKSSSAALPTAIQCAEESTPISNKVARFTLPLCTSINMNACAAFILITVLFVSMSHGAVYSPIELVLWVLIATVAAIGNAGVPMGCYFMSTAFLATMNVPLHILGVILPFYTFIDMFESAVNVWSDSCVAAAVQQDLDTTEAPAQELATEG